MKDVICEETARLCRQVYRDRLRALILTGSLARNEGTFVKGEEGCRLYGDAEFLLAFEERAVLPSDTDLAVIREKIEERVLRRGVQAEVTLSAVHPNYLRRLEPSIFAYELRACGEVVTGDLEVLALIPEFSRSDIPLEDAWRMLANRLVEQLESVDELLEGRPTLSPRAHYRTVKLYLDMATSLLVFTGGYAPTYEERARTLGLLVEPPARLTSWPFPLGRFTDEVVACTEWKVSAADSVLDADRAFWERAMDYAQALWGWELVRLLGCAPDKSADTLMALWMQRQPLHEKLRGWAYVVRRRGWHRGWKHWPVWMKQASLASPRHLVYAAGSALLFALRPATPAPRTMPDLSLLCRNLPVTSRSVQADDRPQLQRVAGEIIRNYKAFVAETRA